MEEVTPPTTIRASGFGAKRRFSVEGGGAVDSDSSPESAVSQSQSSPTSSPSLIPRSVTHFQIMEQQHHNLLDFVPAWFLYTPCSFICMQSR